MGKRSNFERIERDYYPTPIKAVEPLIRHLKQRTFYEPCVGDGRLIEHLESYQLKCNGHSDIEPLCESTAKNALTINENDVKDCDYIITNPPWKRKILHPMIRHFISLRPTFLLFDANWVYTKQAIPFMRYCVKIITIGRVKWIEGSKMAGKDDCCWYHFNKNNTDQTLFYPQTLLNNTLEELYDS
jgi:hypothetical protein